MALKKNSLNFDPKLTNKLIFLFYLLLLSPPLFSLLLLSSPLHLSPVAPGVASQIQGWNPGLWVFLLGGRAHTKTASMSYTTGS